MAIKSRHLLNFGLFILFSQCVLGKPIDEKSAIDSKPAESKAFKDPINVLESSSDTDAEKQTRVSRQNIRILDPDDYDVRIGGNRDVEVFDVVSGKPTPSSPPAPTGSGSGSPRYFLSLLFPKRRGDQMPGLISTLLGSSSSASTSQLQAPVSEESLKRIRRQTEQLLVALKETLESNATRAVIQEFQADLTRQNLLKLQSYKQNVTKLPSKAQFGRLELLENQEDGVEDNGIEDKSPEKEDQDSAAADENSSEEDEPPGGGDGEGGGILGILAGLFGEGGQSDLGTLLTTISSIVGNLSGGPGFDLNTVIASAVGLIGSILAGDGSRPIGVQLAEYYLTILDGLTGGGAMNNGQFFGNIVASLIGGSSAVLDEDGERTENKDSGTFFLSLLSALVGGSSGGR